MSNVSSIGIDHDASIAGIDTKRRALAEYAEILRLNK